MVGLTDCLTMIFFLRWQDQSPLTVRIAHRRKL